MIKLVKKTRCRIMVALTHNIALPLLKRTRKTNPFPYSLNQLKAMEPGTMGNDLAHFIGERQFELLSHYARHDMKHVLLGYDTTEEGELCLQAFMLGNGRYSFPVLASVAFGICTAPEFWLKMRLAYRKGKQCLPIHQWNWFALLPQKTAALRKQIFANLDPSLSLC